MQPPAEATHSVRVALAATSPEFLRELAEAHAALGHTVVGQARSGPELQALFGPQPPDVLVVSLGPWDWPSEALADVASRVAVVAVGEGGAEELARVRSLPVHAYLLLPTAAQVAAASVVALRQFRAQAELHAEVQRLEAALAARKIIERAKGLLMRNHRWSEPEAFRRLQRGAMNRRIPMVDLARQVLEGKGVEL